ncbi:MAG TPA: dephospho-CoA kinase [Candidatus Acidoferrales bacterium]|jgi:dephospho-CoA kinase|nr:dephospho-CoA kinase [Candidatus Acidoferrales bacterium]
MLRAGLTGGIACGKSAVAAMLRECGCAVLDADALAHELIEPGRPAFAEIVREFGPGVLEPGGRIDRAKLGAIVFADAEKLSRLNRIVHPRVFEELERRLAELARPGGPQVAVVEAALLIETGYDHELDRLIVVWCRPEQQRERLAARGLGPEQAESRIAAQMPMEEKRRRATDEIDASGSLTETRQQVERLAAKLKQAAA